MSMIYTFTLNPSIDYIIEDSDFDAGVINRAKSEQYLPGGKGINVAQVLSALGVSTTALGFTGGFTGNELERLLCKKGISCDFVRDMGTTRINVKIKGKEEIQINGCGPRITENEMMLLFCRMERIKPGDYTIFAGSIPNGLDTDIYQKLVRVCNEKGARSIIDAEGELLMKTLEEKPFLIKPNTDEIKGIFNVKPSTFEEAAVYGKKLQEMGAQNVLISMGPQGAVLCTSDGKTLSSPSIPGKVVNTVGAGDSMVAGFVYGYVNFDENFEEAFKYAIAAGSAAAFMDGVPGRKEITALL